MPIHCGTWRRSRNGLIGLAVSSSWLLCLGCGDDSYRLGGDSSAALSSASARAPSVGLCSQGDAVEFIDQMEDHDGTIDFTAGRAGVWFSYNDESDGTQEPPDTGIDSFPMTVLDPPRSTSRYAAHTRGGGFSLWGAGIGLDLRAQQPYDASSYAGIGFWARRAPGATAELRLVVPDGATSPLGGRCNYDAGLCHDDFGSDVELGTSFRFYSYRWDELLQLGWAGKPLEHITSSQIYGLRFQTAPNADFDFWIDDVSLLCRAD
jgi:hypothetical protein